MFARPIFRAAGRSNRLLRPAHRPLAPPSKQIPLRIYQQCSRQQSSSAFQNAKTLFKHYPFGMTGAVFSIISGFIGLACVPYLYWKYIVEQYRRYPEPVAAKLRRAVFYTTTEWNPRKALKYYRQAIEVANDLNMDPFSDEVIGIKLQLSHLFEKGQNPYKAIDVLEIIRRDCLLWYEQFGDKHFEDGKRTRILDKIVKISVKLGELYASEYVKEPDMAEQRLVWAVETLLEERQRRQRDGEKPDEGAWLSNEEMGGSFESLAHVYESKDLHYLATPLFLQALTLSPPKSCHSVILMNNLAVCLSQQTPPPTTLPPKSNTPTADKSLAYAPPYSSTPAETAAKSKSTPTSPSSLSPSSSFPTSTPPTQAALLAQATQWAHRALSVASSITGPDRTDECDVGCVAAMHALGEFAERAGDLTEARRRFEEAISLARKVGYVEGEKEAEVGVRRLNGLLAGAGAAKGE